MPHRVLVPELLDDLPHDDPGARASRRDLRRINLLQGNARWFLHHLRRHAPPPEAGPWIELGAGEGRLLSELHRHFPRHSLAGIDRAPRPAALPRAIAWESADLTRSPLTHDAAVILANHTLHHFENAILATLARSWTRARIVLANEPLRHPLSHLRGWMLHPFVHPITRHDMHASFNAGFRPGELAPALGLDPELWEIHETANLTSSCRLFALRRHPVP